MKEPQRSEFIEAKLKEFNGMRPLVSGFGDQKAKEMLQSILDQWWKDAAIYKDWLKKTLEEATLPV